MTVGRKPQGIEQLEHLSGSAAAKRRLEVLLANIGGQMSVAAACAALGVHESRFFELRKAWLENAVCSLEPERPGRPARVTTAEQQQIAELQSDVAALRWRLRAAELREELALCGLVRRKIGSPAPKKKGR